MFSSALRCSVQQCLAAPLFDDANHDLLCPGDRDRRPSRLSRSFAAQLFLPGFGGVHLPIIGCLTHVCSEIDFQQRSCIFMLPRHTKQRHRFKQHRTCLPQAAAPAAWRSASPRPHRKPCGGRQTSGSHWRQSLGIPFCKGLLPGLRHHVWLHLYLWLLPAGSVGKVVSGTCKASGIGMWVSGLRRGGGV